MTRREEVAISSAYSSERKALTGPAIAGDGAAIAVVALGLGVVFSKGLSPIVAGAGPLLVLIGALIVGWPAAMIARACGHRGVLKAACWGAGLAAPVALWALISGSPVGAVLCLGLGLLGAVLTWLSVKLQGLPALMLPERHRAVGRYFVAGLIAVGVLGVVAQGFIPRGRSESSRTVAAVEVPLRTQADRADLLAMLRRHAEAEGLHVDDGSRRWIEFRRNAPADEAPSVREALTKTIYISVWRGGGDKDLEVSVDDGGHRGRPWLVFFRGDQPGLATKARIRLLAEIRARWPDARDVPVMPNGALPLAHDLVWTGASYAVKPERVAAYGRRGD